MNYSLAQVSDTLQAEPLKVLVEHAEKIYGPDDLLVSGRQYLPRHNKAKGHPYFPRKEEEEGTLFIKGKTFAKLILDYDLELDKIVLREKMESGLFANLLLLDKFIDSLFIGAHFFINASQSFPGKGLRGYYEQIYKGDFIFVIKHDKTYKAIFTSKNPYGNYTNIHSVFFICQDDHISKIASKKALLAYFEPHKKSVKEFMKKNRTKFKKANNTALYNLMKYCDELD